MSEAPCKAAVVANRPASQIARALGDTSAAELLLAAGAPKIQSHLVTSPGSV